LRFNFCRGCKYCCLGLFNAVDAGKITVQQGTAGSNPLNIIVSIIPNNFISAFTTNGNVLTIVFLAVVTGLSMNALEEQTKTLKKVFGSLGINYQLSGQKVILE